MGTWGYSIKENDAAADAYDDYLERFNAGLPAETIEAEVRAANADALEDDDNAIDAELGLAAAQWACGHSTPAHADRLQALIDGDAGMGRYEDDGPRAVARRRKELAKFLAKFRTPSPKPKKPRKARRRQPIFAPGTCLSLRHAASGRYGAGLVLFSPIEEEQRGVDTYGINLIGLLDYLEPEPPPLAVFERREWLYIAMEFPPIPHEWLIAVGESMAEFYPRAKETITVVGHVPLRADDALWESAAMNWTYHDGLVRHLGLWRAARDNPKTNRRRSREDVLDHHPELRERLKTHSGPPLPRQLDLSPLTPT